MVQIMVQIKEKLKKILSKYRCIKYVIVLFILFLLLVFFIVSSEIGIKQFYTTKLIGFYWIFFFVLQLLLFLYFVIGRLNEVRRNYLILQIE